MNESKGSQGNAEGSKWLWQVTCGRRAGWWYGEEVGWAERGDGEGGKGQEGTMFNDMHV